jgi:hypothetical protein
MREAQLGINALCRQTSLPPISAQWGDSMNVPVSQEKIPPKHVGKCAFSLQSSNIQLRTINMYAHNGSSFHPACMAYGGRPMACTRAKSGVINTSNYVTPYLVSFNEFSKRFDPSDHTCLHRKRADREYPALLLTFMLIRGKVHV